MGLIRKTLTKLGIRGPSPIPLYDELAAYAQVSARIDNVRDENEAAITRVVEAHADVDPRHAAFARLVAKHPENAIFLAGEAQRLFGVDPNYLPYTVALGPYFTSAEFVAFIKSQPHPRLAAETWWRKVHDRACAKREPNALAFQRREIEAITPKPPPAPPPPGSVVTEYVDNGDGTGGSRTYVVGAKDAGPLPGTVMTKYHVDESGKTIGMEQTIVPAV